MDIFEMLKNAGVEIPAEKKEAFNTDFRKSYKSETEFQKKVKAVEDDRDAWKIKADTAETTLKGLDGKDIDQIIKERDEWKIKAENAETDYKSKIADREKQDLIKEAMKDIKFSSESARKAIMNQIIENVAVKNGKLIGFNDLMEDAKKNDAGAFVNENTTNNQAKFTAPKTQQPGGNTLTKDQIMEMKDPTERQKAIKENIGLFQKGE